MNKKLFFGLAATFAIAIAAVCTTLALNNTSSKYSALQAANIEALTRGEEVILIQGFKTGDFTFEDSQGESHTIPCCVPSENNTDYCDFGTLDCITLI